MPVSVVPHRAHVVASPQRRPLGRPTALPIARWRTCSIVAAPFGRPTAMSIERRHPFGSRTPAAGFAPPTRHARPLIFSPHATYRRLISSYKFLLSPPLFPVAAPIALRFARSAIAQRAPGRFAPHSFPLHGGETPTGLFFHLQVLPVLAAPPAPLQASAPVALPRPPLGGRSPTTSAAQSPESRLCGGLSASIHPLHPPHRPCPKIIVLRSASL